MGEIEVKLLEQILAWARFEHRSAFLDALQENIKDPKHLKAYELSDGHRTQPDVAKEAGLSQPTVSKLWTKWRRLGLVIDRDGRAEHLLRPSDLGLVVK